MRKPSTYSLSTPALRQVLLLLLLLMFASSPLFAQANKSGLLGSWVKVKVEFKDGVALSDEETIKYSYLRYNFENPNKAYVGFTFEDKGTVMTFSLNSSVLELRNSFGHISNSFLVEKLSADELVMLQMGQGGFESPDCLRYYFIPEEKYQSSIPLKSTDVLAITGIDTLYAASPKVYATYKGNVSFHDYLTAHIQAYKGVVASDNFFLASFIVRKTGEVDSLQIMEGISPIFDKQFVRAFNKAKGKWQPATIGGRSVDVRMYEQFRFVSSANFLPSYDYSKKSKEAMRAKEYLKALYYFDRGLEKLPSDADMLYQRAVCKLQLGNRAAACEDLRRVKAMRKTTADELMEQACN